ncbi:Multidrug resistance protein [Fulvia fulva]|uniref:Multidrug resistance protein n=1 Tax=Passalora fulva TaxID=5499 RepID=A0A9Q8P712_PASFU|nr:Multidrug resistance protein [Fulvia fulva]KAK4629625.1 Multidrug resistance protein [Fulvia fulva]KAK4630470.1 Multidrug resistance protein [Fulvia fulva]UJO15599.1 Multidrug resistance protein [Fulvia fulva]WPV12591.1 Multidrug resistance protein [Fulvia fulva]WPV27455.1 Multidrug resistance protein [Fulvia fulva]
MATEEQDFPSEDTTQAKETSPLLSKASDRRTSTDIAESSRTESHGYVKPEELSASQLAAILCSTYLGIVLAALDGTMVATLTASISASYHSLTLLAWLASSYYIANSVLQPLSGKLTDIYGRRAGLVFSNLFFGVGNLICGLATNESLIIFGRVIAGLGGGTLSAIPLFIASDLVPLRKRGVWQGYNNICYGIGAGLGGVFGGWMNDILNWRWAFLALVPMTVISSILVGRFVNMPEIVVYTKQEKDAKWKRIDFLGSSTLVMAIVLLLVGLNSGGNTVGWTHPTVLLTLPLSGVFLGLFVYTEVYIAVEPVIPVHLFRNPTVVAGCLTNWFLTMAQIALTFYAPIYFQVRGHSAFGAGIRLIPSSVGAACGSILVGIFMRATGKYYVLNIIIQALFLIPMAPTAQFGLHTPDWQPFIYFFFSGFAYAGMLTITVTALIASVEQQYHAVVTSAAFAFRGTGSTIGITICSLVFQNKLRQELWSRFQYDHDGARIVERVRDSLKEIRYLPKDMADDARESYMEALTAVFWTIFALAAVGAVCSLFMRQHTLHTDLARRRT